MQKLASQQSISFIDIWDVIVVDPFDCFDNGAHEKIFGIVKNV